MKTYEFPFITISIYDGRITIHAYNKEPSHCWAENIINPKISISDNQIEIDGQKQLYYYCDRHEIQPYEASEKGIIFLEKDVIETRFRKRQFLKSKYYKLNETEPYHLKSSYKYSMFIDFNEVQLSEIKCTEQ